jgi:hypothetical protein
MTVLAASVAAILLAALAVLQVLVAAGRPYGRLVWGGKHEVLPRSLRIGSAVSVVVYAAMATTLLARAGVFGTPPGWVVVATWVLVGYFGLGIVVNAISRSRPERLAMTPVCAVLTVCSLVVASA